MAKLSKKELDEITISLKNQALATDKFAEASKKSTEASEKQAKVLEKVADAVSALNKNIEKTDAKPFDDLNKKIEEADDNLDSLRKKVESYTDKMVKMGKAAGFKASASIEMSGFTAIQKDINQCKKQFEDLRKIDPTNTKAIGDAHKQLNSLYKAAEDLSKRIQFEEHATIKMDGFDDIQKDVKRTRKELEALKKTDPTNVAAIGNTEKKLNDLYASAEALAKKAGFTAKATIDLTGMDKIFTEIDLCKKKLDDLSKAEPIDLAAIKTAETELGNLYSSAEDKLKSLAKDVKSVAAAAKMKGEFTLDVSGIDKVFGDIDACKKKLDDLYNTEPLNASAIDAAKKELASLYAFAEDELQGVTQAAKSLSKMSGIAVPVSFEATGIEKIFTEIDSCKKKIEDLHQAKPIDEKAIEDAKKELIGLYSAAEGKLKGLSKNIKDVSKSAGFKATASIDMSGFDRIIDDIDNCKKELETLRQIDPTNTKAIEEAEKKLRSLYKTAGDLGKKYDEAASQAEDSFSLMGSTTSQTMGKTVGSMQTSLGSIGSLFGSLRKSPAEFIGQLEKAKDTATGLKAGASVVGKMPGLLGGAGKAAAGLAGALGGVTKVLAGWPGLIAMAVVQVVQQAVKIDAYIKGMNKRFADIRGPEIMTSDVQKQFRDFNLAITNAAANIQDGLRSDQVYDFMAAVGTAGARLTTLNEGFYGYRDAVHVAAKASKVFGMDLSTTGSLVGNLITEYRMNLGDLNKAFVQVAFDAQKSGLTTDRFWEAITNASASLSFYGSFIDGAAKAVSNLTESQLTGAKDASQSAVEMEQVFKKSSMETNMAFIAIARKGGASLKKMFTEVEQKYDAAAEQKGQEVMVLQQKYLVTKDPATLNALDKARKEQAKFQQMARRAGDARDRGDVAMAQDMGMLSEKAPALLYNVMKGIHGANITTLKSGTEMAAIMKGVQGVLKGAVSDDTVRLLIAKAQQSADELRNMVGIGGVGEKNEKSFIKYLKKINSNAIVSKTIGKDQKGILDKGLSAISDGMNPKAQDDLIAGIAKQTGLSKESVQAYYEAGSQNKKLLNSLDSINENMSPETLESLAASMSKTLGVDENQAKLLIKASSTDKNFLAEMKNMVKLAGTGNLETKDLGKKLEKLIVNGDMGVKLEQKNLTGRDVAEGTAQKAYDNTFEQIRNSTLSLEDMKKIAEDDAKYRLVTLFNLDKIASATTALAVKLAGDVYSKPQKEASEALTKAGLSVGQQFTGIGNFFTRLTKDLTGKSVQKTQPEALYDAIKVGADSGAAIAVNESILASLDSINKNISSDGRTGTLIASKLGELKNTDETSAAAQFQIMKDTIKGADKNRDKMIGSIDEQRKIFQSELGNLKGKKDPASIEQVKRLTDIMALLKTAGNGQDQALSLYENTLTNIQKIKKTGKGDTKLLDEQLTILSSIIDSSVDPQTFKTSADKQIKKSQIAIAQNTKIKEDADTTVSNLKLLNSNNEQLAAIMTASIAGSASANKSLLDMAEKSAKSLGGKISIQSLETLYGKSLAKAMTAAATASGKLKEGETVINFTPGGGDGTPTAETKKSKTVTHAGLKEPRKVTAKGLVHLDPGESVLPKGMTGYSDSPVGKGAGGGAPAAEPEMSNLEKVGTGVGAGFKEFMGEFASIAKFASKAIIPAAEGLAKATGNKTLVKGVNNLSDELTATIQESVDFWKLTVDEQERLEKSGMIGKIAETATKMAGEMAMTGGMGGAGAMVGKAALFKTMKVLGPSLAKSSKFGPALTKAMPKIEKTVKKLSEKAGEKAGEKGKEFILASAEGDKGKAEKPELMSGPTKLKIGGLSPEKTELASDITKPKPAAFTMPSMAMASMMKPTFPTGFSIPAPKAGIMDQPKLAAAPAPVTIEINVSADTKDLAKQIAQVTKNEIRGYFYNNSVNNQA